MQAVATLLADIVDYAGLFPPAALSMDESVRRYHAARGSEHQFMLGRFIAPVARLAEFEDAAADLLPRERDADPWRLSAIVGADSLDEDIDAIFEFNQAHDEGRAPGRAVVDAIEVRVPAASAEGASFIDRAMTAIPEQLDPSFELPLGYDLRGLVAALAGSGGHAKLRTGGVTPDLIPAAETIADAIHDLAAADVAFKATAGLHEALRSTRALTYADNPPTAPMHGFLNLFLAATLARHANLRRPDTIECLLDESENAFGFTDDLASWRSSDVTTGQIAAARESFVTSFGSCSFDEPVQSLTKLGLLPIKAAK